MSDNHELLDTVRILCGFPGKMTVKLSVSSPEGGPPGEMVRAFYGIGLNKADARRQALLASQHSQHVHILLDEANDFDAPKTD